MNELINFEKIEQAINLLKDADQLFEVRILKGRQTISGYFKNPETLIKALKTVDLRNANIFYTLNAISEDCYAREQKDCFRQVKVTTSDADIECYEWLLIDLDPVRKTGISSTDAEVIKAHDMAERIVKYLRQREFPAPIMALSGNGIHLLYKIGLKNIPENVELVERCLKALDMLFSDDCVEIDKKVFNPARISKLYGTTAQKGSSTKERPHRMARIIKHPDVIEQVSKEHLMALASEFPEERKATQSRPQTHTEFDLDKWLNEHHVAIHNVKQWRDATKYVLEECPFDSNHKAPDATLIKMPSGAIAFKCLHNSCSGHDWRDFRLKFEPDAYDDKEREEDKRIDEGWKQYKQFNRQRTDISYTERPQSAETKPTEMFETALTILQRPKEERVCIPTGLTKFDSRVGGLAKGEISLISGVRGSAKSTWLSQVALNAVDKGFNVLFYSGELKAERFISWMQQQAAGRDHVIQSRKFEGLYYCEDKSKVTIAKWLGDKFRLYNNDFGSNFKQITQRLQSAIKEFKTDFVVLDNMSILDLSDITRDGKSDKWDRQKIFVETLKNLSMICHCHIAFVAHPRKAQGFLRLDDVGGSGSLGNLVDNAFIVHRNNRDFQGGYSVHMGRQWDFNCGNVIEVVKERETGMQDVFLPLWYEIETKRLLNSPDEVKIYGWDNDGFLPLKTDEALPFE